MNSGNIDEFISHLYRSAPRIAPEYYREWALEQLAQVIAFDAAFWGTGNLQTEQFHYISQLGLDPFYGERLVETLPLNPIRKGILENLGAPVDMSDVYPDRQFYQSELYQQLFKPYGIERILGAGHADQRSGLYTLLSLYRFDRNHRFSADERQLHHRLIYHLIAAASHAFFLHLQFNHRTQQDHAAAICDRKGCFHEAQPQFLHFLTEYFPHRQSMALPFQLPDVGHAIEENGLIISSQPLGELFIVSIRMAGPLDLLTDRESEIVQLVCSGLSFKEAAKTLDLAPSTVSNHLYRIYDKLGISSRTELAKLVGATVKHSAEP